MWNRRESPEINLYAYGQLIYNKKDKNIQWREDNLFKKWCWDNWIATYKKVRTFSSSIYKNKLKMD